ncbi:hypothetical protein INT47_000501 [Mucor saturninus]|uniref:Uncharacterized protein n=1 Tax=Mucor saturninus TaxID=64648 RepID=A0A8H7R031_9FUNG|nr:hypothetical protein INT47_000501 [Mucor saturninus]
MEVNATINESEVMETPIVKQYRPQKTIRIHVNTNDQPRPVIFNYRQLYKQELKKTEEIPGQPTQPVQSVQPVETADDLFFKELLEKAKTYAMDEDDVDDDGSDEESATVGKKQVANDYDFEDPFIDDSEMLLDQPHEYHQPEFDGFFVYHGPLDGHGGSERNKPAATKRRAPTKAKAAAPAPATKKAIGDKARKKAADDHPTEEVKKTVGLAALAAGIGKGKKVLSPAKTAIPAAATAATSSAATTVATLKSATPSSTSTAVQSTPALVVAPSAAEKNVKIIPNKATANVNLNRKVTSAADQPAKKRKKMEKEVEEKPLINPSLLMQEDLDKKKKVNHTPELKPLDPEIEILMDKIRRDAVHEDFQNKAKFPLSLKPTVLEAGLVMFRKYKTIEENLVFHLMTVLPYNRFTLKKFLTTKSGQMRIDELQQEIDELAILLKQTIDKMMPEQQRSFEEKLAQIQTEPANTEDDSAPTPKFKCNDEVRKILYDIIQSEEQSIHIAKLVASAHKDPENKIDGVASDGKARKLMYQRLLSCWPEGWMNSYEMSRQYSQYKSKLAGLSEKKAPMQAVDARKRRKITPQSSPLEEGIRKKQSIAESGIAPPDASSFIQKMNVGQTSVITIDDDDDEPPSSSWNQANSMKIEALISKRHDQH